MADRTWKRMKAGYYLSSDGIQIFRQEEDWPHKDISWDVYLPDGDFPVGMYCTLRAAKADVEKQYLEKMATK